MNAPLRKVAIALFVLFAMLFINLNYWQYVRGDWLRNHDKNRRVLLTEYSTQRGAIVVEGTAVGTSQATTDDRYKYSRSYPAGQLYAHATGYKSLIYGESGIEGAEDSILSGQDDRLFVRRISDMITGRKAKGGNVVLTLDRAVQQTAYDALDGQKGAVAALDPRTGEVLAMISAPNYDPNPLASHNEATAKDAWANNINDPSNPMLNRALNQTYPPGSTFKVLVSSAALKAGYQPGTQVPSPNQFTPENTDKHIQNYNGSSCGGDEVSLKQALTVSCNTAYAMLGTKLGAETIRQEAEAYGFEVDDQKCPMRVSRSTTGPIADAPALAQSSIGQRDVKMTPLEGAMIASAVANDGKLMKPYMVSELQAPDLSVLDTTRPKEYRQPLDSSQAKDLQEMMNSVVSSGTGTAAQVAGVVVGGKTGTAEDGAERQDHAWFIGYAIMDGTPVGAVAVVLENAATSSADSAAIAGKVLKSIVDERR